jgi:hypothetical protein
MLVIEHGISFGIKDPLIEVEAAILFQRGFANEFADCKLNVVNASYGWKLRSVFHCFA